jgi:hypothetical protein
MYFYAQKQTMEKKYLYPLKNDVEKYVHIAKLLIKDCKTCKQRTHHKVSGYDP